MIIFFSVIFNTIFSNQCFSSHHLPQLPLHSSEPCPTRPDLRKGHPVPKKNHPRQHCCHDRGKIPESFSCSRKAKKNSFRLLLMAHAKFKARAPSTQLDEEKWKRKKKPPNVKYTPFKCWKCFFFLIFSCKLAGKASYSFLRN